MSMRAALVDSLQCMNGGWSTMRITTMLICVVVLTMWVVFCFIEGRFIPLGWEMVSLLGGSQAAKAAQLRFEVGKDGIQPPNLREILGDDK